MTGYPLSYRKENDCLYVVSAGIAVGDEKNKLSLFRELKNHKDIRDFERSKDFFICIIKQPLFSEIVHHPKIIKPNPVLITDKGFHVWDLASFDRLILEQVWLAAKKHVHATLVMFRRDKISNILVTRLYPELTIRQKTALDLAVRNGYYTYPKSVTMETLAKLMRVSYSTYQAHLKKAEGKLIPAAPTMGCP